MSDNIHITISDNSETIGVTVGGMSADASFAPADNTPNNSDFTAESTDINMAFGAEDGMPKYVGASAQVERLANGALITMTDYRGQTSAMVYDGSGSSVISYESLTDKPQIEGVSLEGDKTFPELNLDTLSNSEIQDIFDNLL